MAEKRTTAEAGEKAASSRRAAGAKKPTASKTASRATSARKATTTAAKKTGAKKATAAKAAEKAASTAKKTTATAKKTASTGKATAVKRTKTSAKPKTTATKTASRSTKATSARATKAVAKAAPSNTAAVRKATASKAAPKKTTSRATKAAAATASASAAKKTTTTPAKATTAKKAAAKPKTASKKTTSRAAKATAATAAAATAAKPASRRAASTSAKPAAKPARTSSRSATARAAEAPASTSADEAAVAAAAAGATVAAASPAQTAPAQAAVEAEARQGAAETPEEAPRKRSGAGLVALACIAVAAIAGAIGLNMSRASSSGTAPSESPAAQEQMEEGKVGSSQDGASAADSAPDLQVVEAAGMAFNLPANWIKASESSGRAFFTPSNLEESGLVLAASYRYPGGVTLAADELDSAVRQFAVGLLDGDGFTDVDISDVSERTIDGMPAYQVRATARVNEEPMDVYTLAVGSGEQLWAVIAGAETGSFGARQSVFDEIMRSVQITGAPDITAEAPAAAAAPAASADAMDILRSFGDFATTSHEGSGTVRFTAPSYKMPFLMRLEHPGSGTFSVTTLGDDGQWVDTLVNTVGAYSGTVSNYLFYGECAYVEVAADDGWEVTFVPFTEVDRLANGGRYSGDGVFLVEDDALTQLRFAHSGAGTLSVWAFSLTDAGSFGLLLSQSGTFDATVPWSQGKSVIMVNGGGDWSVSW